MKLKRHYLAGNYQVNSFALIESDWASNLRFVSLLKKNKQWTRRSLFGREIRQHLLHSCEIPQPPKMKSLQRIHLFTLYYFCNSLDICGVNVAYQHFTRNWNIIAVTLPLSNDSTHRYSYIKILKQRDNQHRNLPHTQLIS